MATINDALFDASVRHEIFLQRYGGATANKIIGLLNKADADIVKQIAVRLDKITERGFDTGPATTNRMKRMFGEMRVQERDLYTAVGKELRPDLRDLADIEVDIAARRIDEALGVDIGILRPSPEMLRSIVTTQPFRGKLLREWVRDVETAKVKGMRDAIRIGMVEGQTTPQIIRRIRGTRANNFRDGVLEISRRNAEAIVRTSVNHTATRAREMLYEQNQDVVKRVMWLSTLDGRTTPICQGRSGLTFPVGSGPRPPAHVRCRSTTTPVLRSWDELAGPNALKPGRGGRDIDKVFDERLKARGFDAKAREGIKRNTQASLTGQVPGDLNYSDWLKRQPQGFVEDVLGKTKAKLFRDGNLSVDKFVDLKTGRPFTLDELRRKEAQAFMSAGLE